MDRNANPRSCRRCSEKKIRCSKSHPCDSCLKSGSECIFPAPGRVPRRKKRPLKAQLVSRLRSLEEEVRDLTRQLQNAAPPRTSLAPAIAENVRDVRCEHGALLVDEGSTRYVTHEVLVNLGDQIENLKSSVESDSDDLADDATSVGETSDMANYSSTDTAPGNGFVFRFSSLAVSLVTFHPDTAYRHTLWKLVEENVAPVVMAFHMPSIRELITSIYAGNREMDRESEAVIFAIYFAAVTSMDPDTCTAQFGQDHTSLLQHYRFAAEQSLARANFLQTHSLTVLQATTVFLTCLRGSGDASFVWTMTAAVHRIAQGLGLHRDGTQFGLSPYETEIRRRLWWSIYLLDSRSSESRAIGTQIMQGSYDTRLPLNINDSDISPRSAEAPDEEEAFTDMTFCLVRCEMIVLYRQLHQNTQTSNGNGAGDASHSLTDRVNRLEQIRLFLQRKYLQFCDVSIPLQWVTATVIRLALARSWLIAHIPEGTSISDSHLSTSDALPQDDPTREQLYLTAIEVIEFAYLLETDPRTKQWSWLFEGYPQWHAILLLLTEIAANPKIQWADRAWGVVCKAVDRWTKSGYGKYEITPRIILQLRKKAACALGVV
ncbi:fungal-specific transcription factor domain-containing protein [Aspergillus pseudoustus]|uniref:Fungal-specific transcription factor domain-containing protein n=1 Tax=Aspergillus pseudoustus TaxID=1810923 RepID=A0ABR4IY57_9EURO